MNKTIQVLSLLLFIIFVLISVSSYGITDEKPLRELNRRATPAQVETIQVGSPTIKRLRTYPDFSIIRFNVSPNYVKSGEKIKLDALVNNAGNIAIRNIVIRFIDMGTRKKLGEDRVTIGAGQQKHSTIILPVAGSGIINIQAEVDPDNRIKESNENNNKAKTLLRFNALRIAKTNTQKPIQRPEIVRSAKTLAKNKTLLTNVKTFNNGSNLPSLAADLVCYPDIKNGVCYGDGKSVKVKIVNIGRSDSFPCTIGVGVKDSVKIGSYSKWAGKASVPKIFSGQHAYVILPGLFKALPADSIYVVAVDIDNKVDEKDHEDNNYSKPFKYNLSSGYKPTLPPKDKPFEAFDIKTPEQGAEIPIGSDYRIDWYPSNQLNNMPSQDQAKYWKIDISLVSVATGAELELSQDVQNRPINGVHGWKVSLPKNLEQGFYYFRFSTPFDSGWGKSKSFKLYKTMVAEAVPLKKNSAVLKHAITSQKPVKLLTPKEEADLKGLKFSIWKIKSITPKTVVLNGGLGKYARLSSIKVVVGYEVNRPFKFSDSLKAPEGLTPDSIWSIAVPKIRVRGGLVYNKDISYITEYFDVGIDPTQSYPWDSNYSIGSGPYELKYPKGILPKGKNTLTFELDEVGVAHGITMVGRAYKNEKYLKGGVYHWKTVSFKCPVDFYPFFLVDVDLLTYGKQSVESDIGRYGFKNPPVMLYMDPWKKNAYHDKQGVFHNKIPDFDHYGECN